MVGDDQTGHFPRSGHRRVRVNRIGLVATRRCNVHPHLAEHCTARSDLHVDGGPLGTVASTDPFCKAAEWLPRSHVCPRHEHALDTSDFDHV